MVAIASASSAGPYDWLIPMQPRPSAETSSPSDPNLRCCIDVPSISPARSTIPGRSAPGIRLACRTPASRCAAGARLATLPGMEALGAVGGR